MNRDDLQSLSELRLQESKALLAAGFPEGAYQMFGDEFLEDAFVYRIR